MANLREEKFEDAIKATERGVPIRTAARRYGINECTLRLRLRRRREGKTDFRRGAPTFFSRHQEELLANHCIKMANLGYGLSRWQIIEMARNMANELGSTTVPTHRWFYKFINRFKELKMKTPTKREK